MKTPDLTFNKDYDPKAMARFAAHAWRVRDPEKLRAIEDIYKDWYFNRRRVTFHTNPSPERGQVNSCLEIARGSEDGAPTSIYISHRKDVERIVWRQQTIKKDAGLDGLTALEIATMTHDENFGYRHSHGKYINEMNFYANLAHRKIKRIESDVAGDSASDLIRALEKAMGVGRENSIRYDWKKSQPLHDHVKFVERREIRRGVREFLKTLDPQALKILFKARLPDSYFYTWLMGRINGHDEDGRELPPSANYRNRQAAAWAYPMLLPSFVYDQGRMVAKNLDDGMPVPDAIIEGIKEQREWNGDGALPVTKETLKWAQGKKYRFVDDPDNAVNPGIYHVLTTLPWLSAIPREWRPRNRAELSAYSTLKHTMNDYVPYLGRKETDLMREFLAALNRPEGLPKFPVAVENGPPELKSIFAIATPVQAMVRKHADLNDSPFSIDRNMKDALGSIKNQIILPEVICQMTGAGLRSEIILDENKRTMVDEVSSRLFPHIFGGFSVLKMLGFNHRWHRHTNDLQRRTGRIDKDATWTPLTKKPLVSPEGVTIKAMASTKEIRDMGREDVMNNCIGGYTYQCTVEKSHVLVLRDAAGTWMTNMEIREMGSDEKRWVRIVQHSGKGNDENIPGAAKRAADWLVDGIYHGVIKIDWKSIDEGRSRHRHDAMVLKIGFEPENRDACDQAYLAWHGTMQDIFPDADRDAFMERSGLRRAIAGNIAQVLEIRRSRAAWEPERRVG